MDDPHVEVLKEKIVEINNKDIFIKELTENMEELKQKISDLTDQLVNEKQSYDEKLETVNENYEVTLNDLNQKHSKELQNIARKITDVENELKAVKIDYEELKRNNNTLLADFKKNVEIYESSFNKCSAEFRNELENKESEIYKKEQEICNLQQKNKELEIKHFEMMEDLIKKHAAEVQDIEYEMLKTVMELQKEIEKEKRECTTKIRTIESEKQEIEEIARKYEEEKRVLQSQYETKIKQMEENYNEANILAEIQTKQRIEDVEICYKLKLEAQEKESEQILKECQAISEYNIIQCEVEKNHTKNELKEKEEECKNLIDERNRIEEKYSTCQNKFSKLQEDFENVFKQLQETQEKLLEEVKKNEEKTLCDERAYEITIKQLHVTIEALKKRLLNSDRDVEQLKTELNCCEKSKLEIEDKCNKLQEEVQQLQNLNDEFEIQNESLLKVTEEKIRSVEKMLQQKVDDYKLTAETVTKELEDKLKDKEKQLRDAMKQLHQQETVTVECTELIKSAKLELERLESDKSEKELRNKSLEKSLEQRESEVQALKISEETTKEKLFQTRKDLENQISENEQLKQQIEYFKIVQEASETHQKQLAQLQKMNEEDAKLRDFYKNKLAEYEKEIEESANLHKKYIEQSGKYDDLLHKYEILEAQKADLEVKVKEQEILIGPFREQLQAYEMEHKALLHEKHDAENEAREMGLKYAAILGHQNQKQKIKYLIELQKQKFELIEVRLSHISITYLMLTVLYFFSEQEGIGIKT